MGVSLTITGSAREDLAQVFQMDEAVTRALVFPVQAGESHLFAAYLQTPQAPQTGDATLFAAEFGGQLRKALVAALPQPTPLFLWHVGRDWPFLATGACEQTFLQMFQQPPITQIKKPELISQTTEGEWLKYQFRVPPQLVYFQGHFDQEAVVAGVCELKWLSELIEQHTGEALKLARMEAVKFHRLLFPGDVFQLEMKYDAAKAKWTFKFFTDRYKVASGRLCVG